MVNDNELKKLTDDYLSINETRRLAANLNAIEEQRDRLNNPSPLGWVLWGIVGIGALPLIAYFAYELNLASKSFGETMVYVIGALIVAWVDIRFIRSCFFLSKNK